MSNAQAIPDNLYYYSDQMTKANSALQTWIRITLTPAVNLYRETAIDLGDTIPDLTLPSTGSIDGDSLGALGTVSATDGQVHVVGQAFQQAGDSGLGSVQLPAWERHHLPPDSDPNQYGIVTAPDSTISTDLQQADKKQATQLAQYVAVHGFDDSVWQQLAAHEHDPVFCAAFLNALAGQDPNGPGGLSGLLYWGDPEHGGNHEQLVIATIVTAYSGGQLSKTAMQDLTSLLLSPYGTGGNYYFNCDLLQALSHNPQAAANFANSLSQAQMTAFVTSSYIDGLNPQQSDAIAVDFMNLCTAALNGMTDPTAIRAFMDRVFKAFNGYTPGQMGLEGDGTHGDMNAVVSALSKLLETFDSRLFHNPPPGTDPVDWIDQQTRYMGQYAWKFAIWIDTSDQTNINNAVFARQLEESIMTAAALALIPTAGVVEAVSAAMIETAISGWLTPQVDSALNAPALNAQTAELNFVSAQEAYAKLMVTTQLFESNQLYIKGPDGPEPISLESTRCSSDDQLLKWLLEHPGQVGVKSSTENLTNVLDGVGNSYSLHPQA